MMVRAHVSPSDDPRRAGVDLLAIPVAADKMGTLPSQEVLLGREYPSILLKSGSKYPTKLVPELGNESKPCGLPAWPILLMEEGDSMLPAGESIVAAVRRVWHGATIPLCVMEKDWYRLMKGKKVSPTLILADPQWPLLPGTEDTVQADEEDQGKMISETLHF